MRSALALALALALTVGATLATGTRAADGVKATAVATRTLPADLLHVTFSLTDRMSLDDLAQAQDGGHAIAEALRKRGLEVLLRTIVVTGSARGAYSGGMNVFGRDASGKDPMDLTRTHVLRIRGFKRVEEVLLALAQNGVRHVSAAHLTSSQLDAAREELSLEAARLAVARARALARHLDVPVGQVLDVSTSDAGPAASHIVSSSGALITHTHPGTGAAQIGPAGELQVIAAVSATVTLERSGR